VRVPIAHTALILLILCGALFLELPEGGKHGGRDTFGLVDAWVELACDEAWEGDKRDYAVPEVEDGVVDGKRGWM